MSPMKTTTGIDPFRFLGVKIFKNNLPHKQYNSTALILRKKLFFPKLSIDLSPVTLFKTSP